MSWFNESISSLKGQLTNFTKEVLSDVREDDTGSENASALISYQEKVKELEERCSSHEKEIARLKDENVELHRRLGEHEIPLDDASNTGSPDQVEQDWLSSWDYIQSKNDQCSSSSTGGELDIKSYDKVFRPPILQDKEKSNQLNPEVEKLQQQLKSAEQFRLVSERRIAELENDLQKLQTQLFRHISQAQENVSEIHDQLENTKLHLSSETESTNLISSDDILNQLIEVDDKSKKAEENVKILQLNMQHISNDLFSVVRRLGSSEQQEIIYGAIKALELENKILRLRNSYLENSFTNGQENFVESCSTSYGNDTITEGSLKLDEFDSDVMELTKCRAELMLQVSLLQRTVKQLEEQIRSHENNECEADVLAKCKQLELEVASLQEEKVALTLNLEELDQQNQNAIDKVLSVNKTLREQLESLQQNYGNKNTANIGVQTCEENTLSEKIKNEIYDDIMKMLTFEIPSEYFNDKNDEKLFSLIEALIKMTAACKWQRETLERKVPEIATELRKQKQENENLQNNIESLIEQLLAAKSVNETLPSIPENNEEAEVLEQRISSLESEVKTLEKAKLSAQNDVENGKQEILALSEQILSNQDILKQKDKEISDLHSQFTSFKEQLREYENVLKQVQNEKLSLEDQLLQAEKNIIEEYVPKGELNSLLRNCSSLKEELDQLREQKCSEEQQLIQKLNFLENEVTELRNTLSCREADLQHQLKLLQTKYDDLELVNQQEKVLQDNLQDNLKDKNKQLKEMLQSNKQLKEMLQSLQNTITTKEKEYTEFHSQFIILKEQCKESEKSLKELHKEKTLLEEELLNVKEIMQTSKKSQQEYVPKEDFDTVLRSLESLQAEFDQSKIQLIDKDQLEKKLLLLENEITDLKSMLSLKEEQLKDTEILLEERSNELELTREVINERNKEIEDIKNDGVKLQANLEAKINGLEQELLEKDSELHTEQKKQNKSESALLNLEKEVASKLQIITTLETELQRINQNHDKIRTEYNLKLQFVNAEKEKCSNEIADMNKMLNKALSDNTELNNCNKQLQEENILLKAKVTNSESYENEVERLKSELRYKENEITEIEEKLREVNNDVIKYKTMYEEKEFDLRKGSNVMNELRIENEKLRSAEQMLLNKMAGLKETTENYSSKLNNEVKSKHILEEEYNKLKEEFSELNRIVDTTYKNTITVGKEGVKEIKEVDEMEIKEEVVKELENIMENILRNSGEDTIEAVETKLQSLILEKHQLKNSLLERNNDNEKLINTLNEERKLVEKLKEECESLYGNRFQKDEMSLMTKETVSNLSQVIKEKDSEIQILLEKCKLLEGTNFNNKHESKNNEKLMTKLQTERDELIKALQAKHQENVQYHEEIQRLNAVLSQEYSKAEECKLKHGGLVQQFEDKQKLLINTQNELIAVKQRLEKLEQKAENQETCHRLESYHGDQFLAREIELSSDVYNSNVMHLSCQPTEGCQSQKSNQDLTAEVLSLQLPSSVKSSKSIFEKEVQQLKESVYQEQSRNKHLQKELQEKCDSENSLRKELERLRHHMLQVEEGYTAEALRMEGLVKELQVKLSQTEERMKNSSTAYTSVSILANQQVESLQEQCRIACAQRDEIQQKLSVTEDQMQKNKISLRNLQTVLEQFQKDKNQEIQQATLKVNSELQMALKKQEHMSKEIILLKEQLSEAREGLSAAKRLGEQLDKKNNIIVSLKDEVSKLKQQLNKMEANVQSAEDDSREKIDKSLVKNLVLGYCMAPPNRKLEVLRLVGTVLDFTQEDRNKIGLEGHSHSGGSWFQALLQPARDAPRTTTSLSEAFIRFLENESRPHPQLQLLPNPGSLVDTSKERKVSVSSGSDAGNTSQARNSPLLLTNIELPSFTQLPVGRNSSSILKDVLKN